MLQNTKNSFSLKWEESIGDCCLMSIFSDDFLWTRKCFGSDPLNQDYNPDFYEVILYLSVVLQSKDSLSIVRNSVL